MRIALIAAGSRGDAQPAAVLADALQARGHDVVLGVADDLTGFGTALGVPSVGLGFSARAFLSSTEGQRWLADGDTRAYVQGLLAQKLQMADVLRARLLEACEGAELIIGSNLLMDEARTVAEGCGTKFIGIQFAPRSSNRAFAPFSLTTRRLPAMVNAAAHRAIDRATWRATSEYMNGFRRALGLPATRRPLGTRMRGVLELQAYSRSLVPELAGWSDVRPLVGFLTPTAEHRRAWGEDEPDRALLEWLASGPPPVFFGFGSMPILDTGRVLEMVRATCERLGVRGLVGAGWSAFPDSPDQPASSQVRVVGPIDHTTVLSACRAAVHHGGAGTTNASLSAGLPTIIGSVAFDQAFWGRRVTDRRVGTAFPYTRLTTAALESGLREAVTAPVIARARALGAELRAENAAQHAVDTVEASVEASGFADPARRAERTISKGFDALRPSTSDSERDVR